MAWSVSLAAALAVLACTALLVLGSRLRSLTTRSRRLLAMAARRSGLQAAPPLRPEHRPIELIAHEARRLARRFRETRTGVSFAKSEGVRRAYDGVLAEGCAALGLAELLGVLPPGPELDAERIRVERLLHIWGLDVDDAA